MSKEIVTLQLGNLANYVGTHFWNSMVIVSKVCKILNSVRIFN
jgi:hypothetical protein